MPISTAASAAALPFADLVVDPAWIDLYGHMNAARYVYVFDHFGYGLLDRYGIGETYTRAEKCGLYTLDIHASYRRELLVGDPLRLQVRLLACDDKRTIVLMELFQTREGYLAATMEQLSIHVDLATRRVKPFSDTVRASLEQTLREQGRAPLPEGFTQRFTMARRAA